MKMPCGWYGTLEGFHKVDPDNLVSFLQEHHLHCMNAKPDRSQLTAWKNSITILKAEIHGLIGKELDSKTWTIVFEYELPRERGRRPDAIILGPGTIHVLEFKDFSNILQAHIDQVDAYARDIKNYHALSHEYDVIPILVLTKAKNLNTQYDNVTIISPEYLADTILKDIVSSPKPLIDSIAWLNADYAPLPSLVSAARSIFNNEPLPQIRRALSAGIPDTIKELNRIAKVARGKGERHLAFITGVPGSGKTLVGIQFVYENSLIQSEESTNAVFLSGNGPLVRVLQHALKNNVFVQDVHGFLKQYGGNANRVPREHIWIYDEAQRAWDSDRVHEKRGHATSEPEDFLRLGERIEPWSFVIALIGEGQEIHIGEESGLPQWNDALASMHEPWVVHCPEKIASQFDAAAQIEKNDVLDLTVTLRSHLAEDVATWIQAVLNRDLGMARELAQRVSAQGFDMYLTNNLILAQEYVKERYRDQEDKRYGLIASSKAKNLPDYGIHNEFNFTKNMREGPWYNDPPRSPWSCCALRDVATEFSCQGLELDFPIICWGNDMRWVDGEWKTPRVTRLNKARDPHQLRINSYRVLLSRGRDGFIVFVPPESQMAETYAILQAAGMRQLDKAVIIPTHSTAYS